MFKQISRSQLLFFALYFFLFFYRGIYLSYLALYLKESIHFSYEQLGFVGALGSIVAMITIPLIGDFIHFVRSYKKLLIYLTIALFCITCFFTGISQPLIVSIIVVIFESLKESYMPIMDSYTMSFAHKSKSNYGSFRSLGSVGFMLGSVLGGLVIQSFGIISMFYFILLLFLLIIGVLYFMPTINFEASKTKKASIKMQDIVFKYSFISIAMIMFTTIGVATASNEFINLHLTEQLKGASSMIGTMTFIRIIPEIIMIANSRRIASHLGFKKAFMLATFTSGLRWSLSYFALNVWTFSIISMLQSIGIGIMVTMNLTYLKSIMSDHQFPKSVSTYASIYLLSVASMKIVLGMISQTWGTFAVIIVLAIIGFIGFLFTCFGFKEPEDNNHQKTNLLNAS